MQELTPSIVVKAEWSDHFFLSTEEYLHSLISLLNELVRLSRLLVGGVEGFADVPYSTVASGR